MRQCSGLFYELVLEIRCINYFCAESATVFYAIEHSTTQLLRIVE